VSMGEERGEGGRNCEHSPPSSQFAVEMEYHREAKGPAVHKALANHLLVCAAACGMNHGEQSSPRFHPTQASMPAVVRAINTAREREAVARLADVTAHAASLAWEVEAAGARVTALEAQLSDMRTERANTALARARAEQEAKLAREERSTVAAALTEVRCSPSPCIPSLHPTSLASPLCRRKRNATHWRPSYGLSRWPTLRHG